MMSTSEVIRQFKLSKQQLHQFREGRVVKSKKTGRAYNYLPLLDEGTDYTWVEGEVRYTAAGVRHIKRHLDELRAWRAERAMSNR